MSRTPKHIRNVTGYHVQKQGRARAIRAARKKPGFGWLSIGGIRVGWLTGCTFTRTEAQQ